MSTVSKLRVRVVDDEIIVTLPGSRYSVIYYRPENSPQLLAKAIPDTDDLHSHDGARVSCEAWARERP